MRSVSTFTESMLNEKQVEVLHLFDNSICPDPDVFVFITFTIFTLLWALYMSIRSSQLDEISRNKNFIARVLLSIAYISILAVQLLDGCWLMIIFRWGISRMSGANGASDTFIGLVDWIFTFLVLSIHYIVLLLGFLLWAITLLRTAKQLVSLWWFGLVRKSTTTGARKEPLFFSQSLVSGL